METVISALISAVAAIVVCVWNSRVNSDKLAHQIELHQAVTDTKLDELTREVRTHNNFANRMPVVEEQIKVINHRIEDLERGDDGK